MEFMYRVEGIVTIDPTIDKAYLNNTGSLDIEDIFCQSHVHLIIDKYQIIKKTNQGVWIEVNSNRKKFILLNHITGKPTTKRWAQPTIEQAKESFIRRKRSQVRILSRQLESSKLLLKKALSSNAYENSNSASL